MARSTLRLHAWWQVWLAHPADSVLQPCQNSYRNCPRRGSEMKSWPEVRHSETVVECRSPHAPAHSLPPSPGCSSMCCDAAPRRDPALAPCTAKQGDLALGTWCCCGSPLCFEALVLCACERPPPVTHTPPLPARCAKDRCLVLAGTQSGKELVRYPRWMDGHRAQGAPRVKKLHNQPGSCLSHSNPGANKAEGTAGVTAPPLEVLLPPEHSLSFQLSHSLSHFFLCFVLSFFLALSITFSAILS